MQDITKKAIKKNGLEIGGALLLSFLGLVFGLVSLGRGDKWGIFIGIVTIIVPIIWCFIFVQLGKRAIIEEELKDKNKPMDDKKTHEVVTTAKDIAYDEDEYLTDDEICEILAVESDSDSDRYVQYVDDDNDNDNDSDNDKLDIDNIDDISKIL